jgi:hypothetical protein
VQLCQSDHALDQLIGGAQVALQDVPGAIREMEWARQNGFAALALDKVQLPYVFQVSYLGGRRLQGGMVLDFLVLTDPPYPAEYLPLWNDLGAWSAEAQVELPLLAPGAPSNASAMKMGGGVHFLWRDNTSDETRFEIERHVADGAFTNVHNTAANATYWMDMDVKTGETYTYRVRAATPAGLTDWSNEVKISL